MTAPDHARSNANGRFAGPIGLLLIPILLQSPALLGILSIDPFPILSGLRIATVPPLVATYPWIDPNVGWITEPLGRLAAQSWLDGRIPWWDPFTGLGMPLAGTAQAAPLFLPFVLLLTLAHGVVWLRIAMQIVAGLASWALSRQLGLSRTAAFTAGALFELGGTFAWFAHAPILPIAFLPLLLLGLERARLGHRASGGGLVALAIAFSLTAGFPETAYLDGLFALAWACVRLGGLSRPARLRYAALVVAGGLVGLLLAVPALVPFLEFLTRANVGDHAGSSGAIPLPRPAFAMLLLPYLFGGLHAHSVYDPSLTLQQAWGVTGGYLGLAPPALALMALLHRRGRPLGWMRLLCGVWIAVVLAKMAQLPGLAWLIELIPGIPQIAVIRYALPSLILATALLGACAIDDASVRRRNWHAPALAGGLVIVAMLVAWPILRVLGPPNAQALTASLIGAAGVGLALLARRPALLATVATLEAAALFAIPLLGGSRDDRIDRTPLTFLQDHARLQRLYTLGPIQPNFPAGFGVASIDHNMLPVASDWKMHLLAHLDPYADWSIFNGERHLAEDAPDQASELAARLDAYAALGVRYVVTKPGQTPFGRASPLLGPIAARTWAALPNNGVISGELSAEAGTLERVRIAFGVFGASDGAVGLTVCRGEGVETRCATGDAPLADAFDDRPLTIVLREKLAVEAGERLRYRLARSGGVRNLIAWLDADPGTIATPAGPVEGRRVALTALYAEPAPGEPPHALLALSGLAADIYELPDAAPYWQADPACRVQPEGRERATLDCAAPAVLIRREMADPGWTARIDGKPVAVARTEHVFQSIAVPAGRSRVDFSYAPPGARWIAAGFAVGVAGLGGLVFPYRRRAAKL